MVKCPFCGWNGKEFLPFGVRPRKNARCPQCGSLERHRLYYLYLKKILPKDKLLKVLHFAPEKILTELFKSYANINYLSADLNPKNAMVKEDITNISFNNNSFDVVFCSHVLEHIKDDINAMKEVHRILKPEGFAILQVPIKDKFLTKMTAKTFEDFSITEPKERERVFGQSDHVRIYGRDYKGRLESAGFKVKVEKFVDSLKKGEVEKFALLPNECSCIETEGWIYFCTK